MGFCNGVTASREEWIYITCTYLRYLLHTGFSPGWYLFACAEIMDARMWKKGSFLVNFCETCPILRSRCTVRGKLGDRRSLSVVSLPRIELL